MASKDLNQKWIVYMLILSDNSLYTGITIDIEKRIKKHQNGKGSKYVFSRLPIERVYEIEIFNSKSEALKKEQQIKKMSRIKKELLINDRCLYLILTNENFKTNL